MKKIGTFGCMRTLDINKLMASAARIRYDEPIVMVDKEETIPTQPENLETGKSIYLYKACKIPRTQLSEHYKRVLKLEKADIVVVPSKTPNTIWGASRLYVHESDNTLADSWIYNVPDTLADSYAEQIGYKYLGDACKFTMYLLKDIPYYIDYFDNKFDGKIVVTDLELETFLHSNDVTAEITLDDLFSIYDMLKSTDGATRVLGCKTLASMNYAKYPASVSYLLNKSCTPLGSKDFNYVNVKFMHEQLANSGYIYNRPKSITSCDFDYLVKLLKKSNDLQYLGNASFITITDDLHIVPNIKDEGDDKN